MRHPISMLRHGAILLSTSVLMLCANAATEPARLPGDSVYQLAAQMQDQNGNPFQFAQRRGQPIVVSMFYASCQFVCPMLIDTLRRTEESLTAPERAKLSTLLITFDPARDDVAALKEMSEQRQLDPAHWTLARSDAASARKIAATLGIQYRQLANGEFNHTTVLILLDADGRIVGRTKKIGAVDPAFVKLVQQTLLASK